MSPPPSPFSLFGPHNLHRPPPNLSLSLLSLPNNALPLSDLYDLSDGTGDRTGHKVWRGAEVIGELLGSPEGAPLLEEFRGAKVVELGCGGGAGGLAVLRLLEGEGGTVESVAFTDGDGTAVALAEVNYGRNFARPAEEGGDGAGSAAGGTTSASSSSSPSPPPPASFFPLAWSTAPSPSSSSCSLVLACDVIYDLSILPPLLSTASSLLPPTSGTLVLSHVCRSSLPTKPVGTERELEERIDGEAERWGLRREREATLRQRDGEEREGQRGSVLVYRKYSETPSV